MIKGLFELQGTLFVSIFKINNKKYELRENYQEKCYFTKRILAVYMAPSVCYGEKRNWKSNLQLFCKFSNGIFFRCLTLAHLPICICKQSDQLDILIFIAGTGVSCLKLGQFRWVKLSTLVLFLFNLHSKDILFF